MPKRSTMSCNEHGRRVIAARIIVLAGTRHHRREGASRPRVDGSYTLFERSSGYKLNIISSLSREFVAHAIITAREPLMA
jgi:hypothetical protein